MKPYRCVFPTLSEPKSLVEGNAGKYGIKILIPKTDKAARRPGMKKETCFLLLPLTTDDTRLVRKFSEDIPECVVFSS